MAVSIPELTHKKHGCCVLYKQQYFVSLMSCSIQEFTLSIHFATSSKQLSQACYNQTTVFRTPSKLEEDLRTNEDMTVRSREPCRALLKSVSRNFQLT